MSYERLIREHDAIDVAARRIEGEAAAGKPDPALVVSLLNELGCMVEDHLRDEDRTVYGPLATRRAIRPLSSPVDFETAFEELRADWRDYLGGWDLDCITADWEGFVADTTTVMARLRERVRAETDLIYPLALREGTIRLRDA